AQIETTAPGFAGRDARRVRGEHPGFAVLFHARENRRRRDFIGALPGDVETDEMRAGGFKREARVAVQSVKREGLAFSAGDFKRRRLALLAFVAQRREGVAAVLGDLGEAAPLAATPFVETQRRGLRRLQPKGVAVRLRHEARRAEGAERSLGDAGVERERRRESDHEGLRLLTLAPERGLAAIGRDHIAAGSGGSFQTDAGHGAAGLGFCAALLERKLDELAVLAPKPEIGEAAAYRFEVDAPLGPDIDPVRPLLQIGELGAFYLPLGERWRLVIEFLEGLGGKPQRSRHALGAGNTELIRALVEERVDAAVTAAGSAGGVHRAFEHVDELYSSS